MKTIMLPKGRRFSRLRVVSLSEERRDQQRCWICRCDCGNLVTVRSSDLRKGHTRSCGCYYRDRQKEGTQLKHGADRKGKRTPEYRAWTLMKRRCYNKNDNSYKYGGAQGVVVAPEWLHNFPAFLSHIGARPSPKHSIDRIDPWGNYEPGNIRWATQVEQARNHRRHKPRA